jgi:nitroreductase
VLVMSDPTRRFDEGRLAQNLMLAAWAHGIGSCIATFSSDEDVRRGVELLDIPGDRAVRNSIAFGYPADAAALRRGTQPADISPSVVPLGRKPLASLVHWERFGRSGHSAHRPPDGGRAT